MPGGMNLHDVLSRAESLDAADRPAGVLGRVARVVGRSGFLRGAWLGHPVHPLLVTVPIGAWVSAALLDLTGHRAAARQVVGLGLATVPVAVVAGLADYADLTTPQRRVAVTHAAANTLATTLMAASFISRSRNRHAAGAVLSALGLAATGAGGALGGHLSYAQAAGVRRFSPPPFERRPDPVAVTEGSTP
jgi:uncharacterized membrane protein